jgi:hypothetical protein
VEDFITLQQAAQRAGYRGAATLSIAAGRRTVRPRPQLRVTARVWLGAYLGSVRGGNSRHGQRRVPRQSPDETREAGE